MDSTPHRALWGCLFLLLFFMTNCSLRHGLKNPVGGEEFLAEASRLEKLSQEHPRASVRAQSHLRLALLYVNYRNPQLSYERALQEMKIFLSLAPDQAQTDEFRNWLAILREMDHVHRQVIASEERNQELQSHIERLQSSLLKVQDTNKGLRDELASLRESINGLTEAIERLQSLDRQIEEKRTLLK